MGSWVSPGVNRALNDNRRLLKKRKGYIRRKQRYFEIENTTPQTSEGITSQKTSSKRAQNGTFAKMRNEQQNDRYLLTAICLIVIPFFIWAIYTTATKPHANPPIVTEKYDTNKNDKYLMYLTYGDKWLAENKFDNAIKIYGWALKLYPNNYDTEYRLALAYSYKCEQLKYDCDLGKNLITDLLLKHANKQKELLVLDAVFDENITVPLILASK